MTEMLFKLVLLAAATELLVSAQNIQTISDQEVSSLLANSGYVQRQIGCILGRSGCDNTGNQIKLAIPEVLGRSCRSCNARQASNARRIVAYIQSNYPNEWQQIQARYRG